MLSSLTGPEDQIDYMKKGNFSIVLFSRLQTLGNFPLLLSRAFV
jgi:hypothetical protein